MTEVVITEDYYKELRLDAWSLRLGAWELLFICGPFPRRFFRRGLCPPYCKEPKQVDFVYFGIGPFELRIWGWR